MIRKAFANAKATPHYAERTADFKKSPGRSALWKTAPRGSVRLARETDIPQPIIECWRGITFEQEDFASDRRNGLFNIHAPKLPHHCRAPQALLHAIRKHMDVLETIALDLERGLRAALVFQIHHGMPYDEEALKTNTFLECHWNTSR